MSDNAGAVLLDDNEDEAVTMSRLLQRDDLAVEILKPVSSVGQTTTQLGQALNALPGVGVVLMDYRLDDREDVEFRGGTVASMFREQFPDVPVILFTTDQKLHEWVETRPGVSDLFDWRLLKGDLAEQPTREVAKGRIVDIARGWDAFKRLGGDDPWLPLAAAMEVPRARLDVFSRVEANPPNPQVSGVLARWLLHGPLRWDGPLLREGDTRVALGLKPADFFRAADWLVPCGYVGLFPSFGPRWWAEMLSERLHESLGHLNADAAERAALFGSEPEGCVWCGGLRTLKACSRCDLAVDAAHSVRRLSGPAPAWADSQVVCFRCIEDGSAEEVRFAPGSEDVVNGLRSGTIVAPDK